jgi:hypothetical protein
MRYLIWILHCSQKGTRLISVMSCAWPRRESPLSCLNCSVLVLCSHDEVVCVRLPEQLRINKRNKCNRHSKRRTQKDKDKREPEMSSLLKCCSSVIFCEMRSEAPTQ